MEKLAFLVGNRLDRITWMLIAGTVAVVICWLPFASFSLAAFPVLVSTFAGTALLLAAAFYKNQRQDPKIAAALAHVAQMTLFTCFGAVLSYLIAANDLSLWDSRLYALDRALGFDWLAYLKAVDERPWLGSIFNNAYQSLIPQMIVLITVLSFAGQFRDVRIMMFAAIVTGLITIIVSGLMPAMAMFVHLELTPSDFPNLSPAAAFVHVADLNALRAGTLQVLDISKAQGIVTFPSYHAAMALILLVAGWSNRWLRWPFVLLNLAMMAATPIDGGHYLVDVAAGIAIAAVMLAVAHRLVARDPQTAPRSMPAQHPAPLVA